MPWKDREKKRAADRQRVARKRARLREHRRLTARQWHQRQLGPDHDWSPATRVSLEQWRWRSKLWLVAEREQKRPPLTEADLAEMRRTADEALAAIQSRFRRSQGG